MISALDVLFALASPLAILHLRRTRLISTLGTAGAAYCAGMGYSLLCALVHSLGLAGTRDVLAGEVTAYAAAALAMPLLLFPGEVRRITRVSREVLLSFALLALSVILASAAACLLFAPLLPDVEVLGGMATALYTGGTPNLNAVACAFRLDNSLILAANLSDMIFGGVFYVFLLLGAPALAARVLGSGAVSQDTLPDIPDAPPFSLRHPGAVRNLLLSFSTALLCAGAGALLWLLGGRQDGMLLRLLVPTLMIGTTVGGIALSFCPSVCAVRENEAMGQYFVCVFCCAIATLLDPERLRGISLPVFAFFAGITLASFVLHLLLCRLFSIRGETMLVTVTAGIYGPAFVPGVCRAAHAEALLGSGLVAGALGYAGGTVLGSLFTILMMRLF